MRGEWKEWVENEVMCRVKRMNGDSGDMGREWAEGFEIEVV